MDKDASALAAENERLRAGLQEIADLSLAPDDFEWWDCWGDRKDYPVLRRSDGTVRTEGVDPSNYGDVESFGIAHGEWVAAKIARQTLNAK